MRGIKFQDTKFYTSGCHQPSLIFKNVAHVARKRPKVNSYDTLKREVLALTSNSKEAQFRQLMSYSNQDNQILPHLMYQQLPQILAYNVDIYEQTFYCFWSAGLQRNIKTFLNLQPKYTKPFQLGGQRLFTLNLGLLLL